MHYGSICRPWVAPSSSYPQAKPGSPHNPALSTRLEDAPGVTPQLGGGGGGADLQTTVWMWVSYGVSAENEDSRMDFLSKPPVFPKVTV